MSSRYRLLVMVSLLSGVFTLVTDARAEPASNPIDPNFQFNLFLLIPWSLPMAESLPLPLFLKQHQSLALVEKKPYWLRLNAQVL